MGKKAKVGKARKDKFYELAKSEGFRSRAAYKLLQLDGKFDFLNRSTVCIDLCAAPGGWLQAARKRMPVSSIIIGVDLVPIRQIPNVMTLQEDITTDKCKQEIHHLLHDRKANIVLHDGAPNVGKNWLHDAFQQAQLTLHALKLATVFLAKGGHFLTKIFRSKDYNALLWVFGQMFQKVHSTKPQASRNESAEIFVFCQGFLAPTKIDQKFFDMKFVFKDVDVEPKQSLNLVHPEKRDRKAHGYAEGDYTLEHKLSAIKFIADDEYLELLRNCTEIIIDDDRIVDHKLTTNEIKECCKDIRLLGKKDIRHLLSWQKTMKKFLAKSSSPENGNDGTETEVKSDDEEEDEDEEEAELKEHEEEIAKQKEDKEKELRKKKKHSLKEKRKIREKLKLQMVIPGDRIDAVDDIELFSLKAVQSQQDQLADVGDREVTMETDEEGSEEELVMDGNRKEQVLRDSNGYDDDDDVDDEEDVKDDDDDDDDEEDVKDVNTDDDDDDDIAFGGGRNQKLKSSDSSSVVLTKKKRKKDEIEIVPTESATKKVKLNPFELALGEEIIKSSKRRREIVEMSYHRYVHNDESAPEWFVKDESRHCHKQTPVTKDQIETYKERQKAIDAQPIKKIAEAQARKKRKMAKRLDKARKKAEVISDNIEMTEREKMKQAKEIYKKAGLLKGQKRSLTYIVAKKHTASGRRVSRPSGVKGHYRVVDPRMKKDKKKQKMEMKKGKKGKKGKPSKPKPKRGTR